MAHQPHPSAEELLAAINTELRSRPGASPVSLAAQIRELRQRHNALRANPVTGRLAWLKSILYRLHHSTFAQQFNLNEALLDLVETLVYETEHRFGVLEQQAAGASATPPGAEPPAPNLPGLAHIFSAPVEMLLPERLALYSLIYGLKPTNYLEIGTFRGGSALIVCGAMDDNGRGQIVCVDPAPRLTSALWQQISHRATLIRSASPGALAEAARAVENGFDVVLIDGDHSYDGVVKDIEGLLPLLADEAHLLFHDAHYDEIKVAINHALAKYPHRLADAGLISVESSPGAAAADERPARWGGLRLLIFSRL